MKLPSASAPFIFRSFNGYRRANLASDLAAGLLVAALALPQSLGYAAVAKVPVQVGMYTLPPALLAYAIFGSSRLLYMGPISTVSLLSGSAVLQFSGGDPELATTYTAALSIAAGVLLVVAGALRMGWVAAFLSEPIVTGFVTGLVVLIVVGEVPALFGLHAPSGALFGRVWFLLSHLTEAKPLIMVVSAVALVLLFGGAKIAPKVPWSLVVLVLGIVVSDVLDLAGRGLPVVGSVPSGVPVPHIPLVSPAEWGALLLAGGGIAAIGLAEGLAAARTFRHPDEDLRDDTEMIANGAADIISGFFGGMGVGGSLSKTAANARAGARTQMAGVFGALAVTIVLMFAAGLLATLPKAVLSAIVVNAVWGLVKPSVFRRYAEVRRNDFVSSLVALAGVLIFGPLNGLAMAVVQSLLGLLYRMTRVNCYEIGKVPGEKAAWGSLENDDRRRQVPRLLLIRLDAPLFWANVEPVMNRIRAMVAAQPDTIIVVLDLEASNQMDTTTADQIAALVRDLHADGRDLYLAKLFESVRSVLESAGVLEQLGEGHVWRSMSSAVKAARKDPRVRRAVAQDKAAAMEQAADVERSSPLGAPDDDYAGAQPDARGSDAESRSSPLVPSARSNPPSLE